MEKLLSKVKNSAIVKLMTKLPKWEKINMVVGYAVAISVAALSLVCQPFDGVIFTISLIWGIFGLRLDIANVRIKKMSVVIMWCIFYFGLCGILMWALKKVDEFNFLGGLCAGFVLLALYRYTPILSYYLRYNDKKSGTISVLQDFEKTKYNGCFGSFLILCLTLVIVCLVYSQREADREEQQLALQIKQETFVPVKKVSEEMINGNTFYILEAKGYQFKVSPLDHPSVRNINSNSKVKVILGDDDVYPGLRKVKKIQFEN